jgi:hypothetical protein
MSTATTTLAQPLVGKPAVVRSSGSASGGGSSPEHGERPGHAKEDAA